MPPLEIGIVYLTKSTSFYASLFLFEKLKSKFKIGIKLIFFYGIM